MTVIPWRYGAPPRPEGDLTDCLVLQATGLGTARLMLIRALAPGATPYVSEGFGYLCCPVVRDMTGHIYAPEVVLERDILCRWTTYVPIYVVSDKAYQQGVRLQWPATTGAA